MDLRPDTIRADVESITGSGFSFSVDSVSHGGDSADNGASWHFLSQDKITLKPPATVAGLRVDDSDNAQQTADYLRTAVAAKIRLDHSVGAVYRSHDLK